VASLPLYGWTTSQCNAHAKNNTDLRQESHPKFAELRQKHHKTCADVNQQLHKMLQIYGTKTTEYADLRHETHPNLTDLYQKHRKLFLL
jgi:hypothetical protein